uniref:Uncharacterized protein n=1 Tax=Pseudomonas phage RVTF4 TaxID=3236931 RepID=A0AB39CC97_9VIRU
MLTPEAIAAIATRKFFTKQMVWAAEDIMAVKPGLGMHVYARKGDPLHVMSFDPNADAPHGVRLALRNTDGSAVESYRNVSVKDAQLSASPIIVDAESVGL